jgi:hypothetical protein
VDRSIDPPAFLIEERFTARARARVHGRPSLNFGIPLD